MTEHRKHASAEMLASTLRKLEQAEERIATLEAALTQAHLALQGAWALLPPEDAERLGIKRLMLECKRPECDALAAQRELEEGLSGQAEEGGAEMTSEEQARDWHRRLSALPAESQEWAAAMFRMVEEARQIGFEQGRQAERERVRRIVREEKASAEASFARSPGSTSAAFLICQCETILRRLEAE